MWGDEHIVTGSWHGQASRPPQARAEPVLDGPCPDCDGAGHTFRQAEDGYEYVDECHCTGLLRFVRRFNAARFPPNMHDVRLDTTRWSDLSAQRDNVEQMCASWETGAAGLLIYGPTGTGKTHLAVAMARSIMIRHEVGVLFVRWPRVVEAVKRSFSSTDAVSSVLDPVQSAKFLVVDELGGERASDFTRELCERVIGGRLEDGLTSIVTTNLAPDDLREHVGDRVNSRMARGLMSLGLVGKDQRGR